MTAYQELVAIQNAKDCSRPFDNRKRGATTGYSHYRSVQDVGTGQSEPSDEHFRGKSTLGMGEAAPGLQVILEIRVA